jgi:putative DNA primase/helicase
MKILPAIVVPELPPLDGVVTTPYLDADGNVVATDGYHPGTRLVLLTRGLTLPPVGDPPTEEEVQAAVDLIVDEWLADFPWADTADMVNATAGLLSVTGRHFFPLAPVRS